jgi:hypothetical protein
VYFCQRISKWFPWSDLGRISRCCGVKGSYFSSEFFS